jgi:uncharacterized protein
MNLPISTSSTAGLVLAACFGFFFGFLLNKGRVTDYNVIVNFFRVKDWTVMKVMLTAIVVGGIGVAILHSMGLANYHIKPLNLGGVLIGGALFGIGMAVYGYCPGTGVAAIGTGSLHALVGFFGMLVGGIAYAFSHAWFKANLLASGDLGKLRLNEIVPIGEIGWWAVLLATFGGFVWALLRWTPKHKAST